MSKDKFLITFIVCTYNRKNELNRLLKSAKDFINKYPIKFVVFNYNDYEIKVNNTKNITFEIINKKVNNGKSANFIDYVKDNLDSSKYFCLIDDKDFFTQKLDKFLDYINETNKELYSLRIKFNNHPNQLQESIAFKNGMTMYSHYVGIKKRRDSDRLWIFASNLFKDATYPNFVKNEISIQGMIINNFYYTVPAFVNDDDIYVCREYLKNGYSNSRNCNWIERSPNSELYECYLFYKVVKNPLMKLYLILLFEKKYELAIKKGVTFSTEIEDIRKKLKKYYYCFFYLKPLVK